MQSIVFIILMLVAASTEVTAAQSPPATASMVNPELQQVGEMTVTETPSGILIRLNLQANPPGIAPGEHGIHIHEVGQCVPPFTSAGAHFNPAGKKHGFLDPRGKHAGGLPNLHVTANAPLTVDFLVPEEALGGKSGVLMDADGC